MKCNLWKLEQLRQVSDIIDSSNRLFTSSILKVLVLLNSVLCSENTWNLIKKTVKIWEMIAIKNAGSIRMFEAKSNYKMN